MVKSELYRLGRESLIARESAKKLALLGETEKGLKVPPRRRAASRREFGG
jgi:hypothetical protein